MQSSIAHAVQTAASQRAARRESIAILTQRTAKANLNYLSS
jgi:hypothetical protein